MIKFAQLPHGLLIPNSNYILVPVFSFLDCTVSSNRHVYHVLNRMLVPDGEISTSGHTTEVISTVSRPFCAQTNLSLTV